MSWITPIQICATFGPIILAVMGVAVSLIPPSSNSRGSIIWAVAFALIGGATAISLFNELRGSDALLDHIVSQVDRLIPSKGGPLAGMTNSQLKERTIFFAQTIRDFDVRFDADEEKRENEEWLKSRMKRSEDYNKEQARQEFIVYTNQTIERRSEHEREFTSKFRVPDWGSVNPSPLGDRDATLRSCKTRSLEATRSGTASITLCGSRNIVSLYLGAT
jgi:hypothetical protein